MSHLTDIILGAAVLALAYSILVLLRGYRGGRGRGE